tara:strand:- start:217 stop:1626 length:1410 start_codon:yes stop_codon:yes gene_type:complete
MKSLIYFFIFYLFTSSSFAEFNYYGSIDPTKHYKNLKNRSYNDKIGRKDLWIDKSIKLDTIDFKINNPGEVLPKDYFNRSSCRAFYNQININRVANGDLGPGMDFFYSKPIMLVGKGYDKKKDLSGAPDAALNQAQQIRLWMTSYLCYQDNKFKENLAREIKSFILKWAQAKAFMETRKNNSDSYCCIQDAVLNMNLNMSDFITAYLIVTKDFPDNKKNKETIVKWFKNYMKKYGNRHFKKDSVGQFFNQHAVIRDYLNAKIAILTNNNELFSKSAKRALLVLAQSTPEGVYPYTAARGQKAMWYSMEMMNDYTHLLEVLRAQGYDLYNYELEGRSYKKNAEFLMGVWVNYACSKGFIYENKTNEKLQKGTSYRLCEKISENFEYKLLQYYAKINSGSDGRLPKRSDPKIQNLTMYKGGNLDWVVFFNKYFPNNKYSEMSLELSNQSIKKKNKWRSKGNGVITSMIFSN